MRGLPSWAPGGAMGRRNVYSCMTRPSRIAAIVLPSLAVLGLGFLDRRVDPFLIDATMEEKTIVKTIRMEEMTWPAIRAAVDAGRTTVVVAVGSTEQHGPHLPTMTDARIGDALAELVARRLGNALVARTIDVGISDHHLAFAGTLSLRPETLAGVLRDYVASLERSGFRRIVFVPTHGGNFPAVQEAIDAARRVHRGIDVVGYTDLLGFAGFLNTLSKHYGVTAEASGAHAGESETSIMMALEPGLVVAERFEPGYLGPLGAAEVKRILERGMPDLTANGVLGDPRDATAQHGATYLERLADFLVEHLEKPVGQSSTRSGSSREEDR